MQQIHCILFEAFIAETYVQLAATDVNVLRTQALRSETSYLANCLTATAPTLYCVVSYIAACVDTSRMVLWDRSVLC